MLEEVRSQEEVLAKIDEFKSVIADIEKDRDRPTKYDSNTEFPPPEPKEYYDRKIGEVQEKIFLLQWVLGKY